MSCTTLGVSEQHPEYCSSASPNTSSSLGLRFSLVNDSEGWLCIKEVSGEVHTAQSLQGAQPGDTYTVLVEAQDTGMITQQWSLLKGLQLHWKPLHENHPSS